MYYDPEEVGYIHVSYIPLITLFDFVFHVIPNSCNTKLKNDGIVRHLDRSSRKGFEAMYFVL